MRYHYFQHVPYEPPSRIGDWVRANGHSFDGTHLYRGDAPPPPDAFDALVIMGGPMGVHDRDRHPWLADELAAVEQAIAAGKRVIGVCLGAQLIAAALCARVYRNREKEIGWFPVTLTPEGREHRWMAPVPDTFLPFHWHGDTFDLPDGAKLLSSSEGCRHQMFEYDNRVLGIQFHLEMDDAVIGDLARANAADVTAGPFVQPPEQFLGQNDNLLAAHRVLDSILSGL